LKFLDKLDKKHPPPSLSVGKCALDYFHRDGTNASSDALSIIILENIMKTLSVIVAALAMSAGIAVAQTPATPTAQPSVVTKVEHWTTRQWNAARADWARDKTKWADCQQQSTDQKLTGRKSWSFLYTCMNA
jgi:hypothetical protein